MMRQLLTISLILCVYLGFAQNPNITQIEFFFDTDPGFGNATQLSFTPSDDIQLNFLLDIGNLNEGIHSMYVRAKDENDNWSLYAKKNIFIVEGFGATPFIVEVEYFWDTDPGFGNGTNVPITANKDIDHNFTIPINNLSSGLHSLYIRSRDMYNRWSLHTKKNIFIIEGNQDIPNIVEVEYFWDTDPGFGNGTNVPITASTNIDHNFTIPISNLSSGLHSLYIRSRDMYNRWSLHTKKNIFIIEGNQDIPNIVEVEYFWDTDPGFGNGTPLSITAATSVDEDFVIAADGLSEGIHQLYVRSRDAYDNWSLYTQKEIQIFEGSNAINLQKEDFGNVPFGSSITKNVSIENVSDTLLEITSIFKTDTENTFELLGVHEVSLEPNEVYNFAIRLNANSIGDKEMTLHIVSNALDTEQEFVITGSVIESNDLALIVPPSPTANGIDKQSIKLNWSPVDGALNYRLYKNTEFNTKEQIYWGNGTTYLDTKLEAETSYTYSLKVENATSISLFSDDVIGTTLDDSITVPVQDLRPVLLSPEENVVWNSGTPVLIDIGVYNAGTISSIPVKGQLYLTTENQLSPWDYKLGNMFDIPAIAVNETFTTQIAINTPQIQGSFYLAIGIDPENNENDGFSSNNSKVSETTFAFNAGTTENKPDIIGSFEELPFNLTTGVETNVKVRVTNLGIAETGNFEGKFYLSEDRFLTDEDIEISVSNHESLTEFCQNRLDDITFTIPTSVAPNTYYLIYNLDHEDLIDEVIEINNLVVSSDKIDVLGAGLIKISGRVLNVSNLSLYEVGVPEVSINGVPGNIKTDSDGYFDAYVPTGWSGEISAKKEFYIISAEENTNTVIENIQENITINFEGGEPLKMVGDISHKLNKKLLPKEVQEVLGSALFKKTSEYINIVKDIKELYSLLRQDKEDITKYFEIAEFLSGKSGGPVSIIASAYIYILKETFQNISNIGDLMAATNFALYPDKFQFNLKITSDKTWFFGSPKTIDPSLYTNYLQARMLIYVEENGELVLKATRKFRNLRNVSSIYRNELLLGGDLTFSPDASEFAQMDKTYFVELNWLNNQQEVVQTMLIPASEPYISDVGFVSSDWFRIELTTENNTDLDFSNGAPFLKLKHD